MTKPVEKLYLPWHKRPAFLAVTVLTITLILNVIFW
jgi:hypothetical protein